MTAEEVVAAIRRGEAIRHVGVTVRGRLVLDGLTIAAPFVLQQCRIDALDARNARFKADIDLEESTIGGDAIFLGAAIDGLLNLTDASIGGDLSLWNCRIVSGLPAQRLRVDGDLIATEVVVNASLRLTAARVRGNARFTDARIGRTLSLDGGARIGGALDAGNAQALNFRCDGSVFGGAVSFDGANAGADAVFINARFRGDATFTSMKVDDELRLDECRFRGSLDLSKLRVRDLLASGARFTGAVSMDDGEVGLVANFAEARFAGNVSMNGGKTGDLNLRRAALRDVVVQNLAIAARLVLQGAVVAGALTVRNTSVVGNLEAAGISADGATLFSSTTVGGNANFGRYDGRAAVFSGGLNLESVTVKQNLDLRGVSAPGRELDLTGTTVGGELDLREAAGDDIDLSGASIGARALALTIACRRLKLANVTVGQDAAVSGTATEIADLYGTEIKGTLTFAEFTSPRVNARYITVRRDLVLTACAVPQWDIDGGIVTGKLDLAECTAEPVTITLRGGAFGSILLNRAMTATDEERALWSKSHIDLADSTYSFLRGDPNLVAGAFPDPANRQPYLMLEQSLRRRGFEDEANRVYVAGLKAARAKRHTVGFVVDAVSYALTRYGVSPWRAFVAFVIAVALGWCYFFFGAGAASPPKPDAAAAKTQSPCRTDVRVGPADAAMLSLSLVVPTGMPASSWSAAPDCPVQFGGRALPADVTKFVEIGLRLFGLLMVPVTIGMLAGLIRPAARQ